MANPCVDNPLWAPISRVPITRKDYSAAQSLGPASWTMPTVSFDLQDAEKFASESRTSMTDGIRGEGRTRLWMV